MATKTKTKTTKVKTPEVQKFYVIGYETAKDDIADAVRCSYGGTFGTLEDLSENGSSAFDDYAMDGDAELNVYEVTVTKVKTASKSGLVLKDA